MFVAVVSFPPLPPGRAEEFQEWFEWSNGLLRHSEGFLGRRLLAGTDSGEYAAIVEHATRETFQAMHRSAPHAEIEQRLRRLLAGQHPTPRFYEVIVSAGSNAASNDCCRQSEAPDTRAAVRTNER